MLAYGWKPWPFVPRVLAGLYALFIALFALDAFGGGDFWSSLGAFAIHLIPAAFLGGLLLIAWYNEVLGGVLYVALGLAYVLATGGKMAPSVYVLITGALVALGVLFLMSWGMRRRSGEP
jgi:hypothetical protein